MYVVEKQWPLDDIVWPNADNDGQLVADPKSVLVNASYFQLINCKPGQLMSFAGFGSDKQFNVRTAPFDSFEFAGELEALAAFHFRRMVRRGKGGDAERRRKRR
jgi:hypothetical protein